MAEQADGYGKKKKKGTKIPKKMNPAGMQVRVKEFRK